MAMHVDIESPPVVEPSNLSEVRGLSTLNATQKKLRLDSRRFAANDSLNTSMQTWIARRSPCFTVVGDICKQPSVAHIDARKSHISTDRQSLDSDCILSLHQAYSAHSAAFDIQGEGTINVEELIIIFDRCKLFDAFFTKNKVRNYFSTWANGCNQSQGGRYEVTDARIEYEDFKVVLQWAADMKAESIGDVCRKVVRLSRKVGNNSASWQRSLEVVFDAFCKHDPKHMSAFEFGSLCQKVDVYESDKFSMGDVFSVFFSVLGVVHSEGVDFGGFIEAVTEVGKRLEIGDQVFDKFSNGVEFLDTDEEILNQKRKRLREAAAIVGGSDWLDIFRSYNPNGSGFLDWDEFMLMCREKLHLADRDNHLRVVFDTLDYDGSGELEIAHLLAFLAD